MEGIPHNWIIIAILTFILIHGVEPVVRPEPFPSPENVDWSAEAEATLQNALKRKQNTNIAKNVILFVGDGMDITTITAARIYGGQLEGRSGEENRLNIEKFPHVALSKTYNVDAQGPDSAGTATALLCGVKANSGTVGVNQNIPRGDCTNAQGNSVDSILTLSDKKGKSTGIVTTTRITHATPAAAYAHHSDRDYEFNLEGDKLPAVQPENCGPDIATQLVRNNSYIKVLMGGGRRAFYPAGTSDPEYPSQTSRRTDNYNLIQEWIDDKDSRKLANAYVWNKDQFDQVDTSNTEYLLGLFEYSHTQYQLDKEQDGAGEPTLVEMTEKAIEILSKDKDGFFLLVESGRVDHAHHDNTPRKALDETLVLDVAVKKAIDMTDEEDTLIVVTADHGHVFSVGGYSQRGNPILGLIDQNYNYDKAFDDLPYTSLYYANGAGYTYPRPNLTEEDMTGKDYLFPSGVGTSDETHGAQDVAIFARGPMSHLFHGVHEQNYISHVMMYASCVGKNTEHCDDTNESRVIRFNLFTILTFVSIAMQFKS